MLGDLQESLLLGQQKGAQRRSASFSLNGGAAGVSRGEVSEHCV